MSIDLDDIESRINEGIYENDRMTSTASDDAFSALAVLLAEVERLRVENSKLRDVLGAAVSAALRRFETGPMGLSLVDMASVADAIERGEHVGWSEDDTSRKAILDRKSYRP